MPPIEEVVEAEEKKSVIGEVIITAVEEAPLKEITEEARSLVTVKWKT